MEESISEKDALLNAEVIVKELYEFRDGYLLNKGIENAKSKHMDIMEKAKEELQKLDSLQLSIHNKAQFFGLRGKILNISQEYDSRAVECLSKALKLDPDLIDSWNELGECYWKNKDIDAAYNCFNQANSKVKNKVSLRNLSMVQRQLGKDYNERVTNIKESVSTAKVAVSLDVTDGKSWYVLGNAYLSSFFFAGQNPADLKQCMIAYTRAEKDQQSLVNPDLYYNKAVAFKYQEDFTNAFIGYEKACQLDPEWTQPIDELKDLKSRLMASVEMIKSKGQLKAKRIQNMLKQFKEADYGPFASGTYTSPLNNQIKLNRIHIKDLKEGRNDNCVVCCKVVALISTQQTVPFPCIIMDSTGECIALSVFNLAIGKGLLIGDTVAIPEPFLQVNDVLIDNEELHFSNIRVDNPIVMVVNKRKVGTERLAFSVLSVINKSE